jgi:hypothetical protein
LTLVVAQTTALGVRLAADMRVTDPDAARSGFLHSSQLKLILLSPTLCIGYAGNVGAALVAIRDADVARGVEAVEQHLLAAHERSGRNVDFVVASLRPTRLVAVKEGRAEACDSTWLGDSAAFAEYEEHYSDQSNFRPPAEFYDSHDREADTNIANDMGAGMQAVVFGPAMIVRNGERILVRPEGGRHATVGDAIIRAGPRVEDDLFAYFHENRASAPFGSAAGGGFSYFVLTPENPGVAAVGIYFQEGRLGVLYAPLLLDDPERERFVNVSIHEFIELVHEQHGLRLRGLVADPP